LSEKASFKVWIDKTRLAVLRATAYAIARVCYLSVRLSVTRVDQ